MDFRVINANNLPEVMKLWDYCFEKNDTPFFKWYFDEYCLKQNMILGAYDKATGKLMNMLHLNPYTINLRNQNIKVSYIVGVATAPEFRGRHLFAKLLDTLFTVLRAQRQAFVLLMPINAGIYRPYNFEFCYYKHAYELPLSSLPKLQVTKHITLERVSILETEYFTKIYTEVMSERNGNVQRDKQKWLNLVTVHNGELVQAIVAKEEECITGYMFYSINDNLFTIHELITKDIDVRNSLLEFSRQHITEAKTLSWLADEADKTYLYFSDQKTSGSLMPFMMARCINVRQALEELKVKDLEISGVLKILIHDKNLPLNNGLLEVKIENGKIDFKSTTDEEDLEMDIATFTQLYFGQFTVEELLTEGKIKAKSLKSANILARIFPKCNNYINEYF